MTELGFGLVDRRTVVVVLMTLILCRTVFGFDIPLETTDVLTLLISLIFFTAYLYMARTLLRLPFVIYPSGKAFLVFYQEYKTARSKDSFDYDYMEAKEKLEASISGKYFWESFWGILDRAGLILIIVIATLPSTGKSIVEITGIVGVIFMLIIYLVRGHFSFAVEDALKKGLEQQEQLAILARPNIPSFPNVVQTTPYYGDYG